jgi:hypothetical protein
VSLNCWFLRNETENGACEDKVCSPLYILGAIVKGQGQ